MYYLVQVHQRIPEQEAEEFVTEVERILNDPRGWEGLTFTRVNTREEIEKKRHAFLIRLLPVDAMEERFPSFEKDQLSVADLGDRTININHCRWTEQCPNASELPLDQYHEYLIMHEVGHILGKNHPEELPSKGPAPVMMQQTLGIHGLQPNSWPTKFDHEF